MRVTRSDGKTQEFIVGPTFIISHQDLFPGLTLKPDIGPPGHFKIVSIDRNEKSISMEWISEERN